MAERVHAEAAALLPADAAARLRAATDLALAAREDVIRDDHDPRYLHPARTLRILLADTTLRDADALVAAAFVDSVDPSLAPDPRRADAAVAALIEALPLPGADCEDLLERLVTADSGIATAALAERLDHARHLHLRPDLDWAPFHASIRAAYVPAARRIGPLLARRFERWADAFERRLLLRG